MLCCCACQCILPFLHSFLFWQLFFREFFPLFFRQNIFPIEFSTFYSYAQPQIWFVNNNCTKNIFHYFFLSARGDGKNKFWNNVLGWMKFVNFMHVYEIWQLLPFLFGGRRICILFRRWNVHNFSYFGTNLFHKFKYFCHLSWSMNNLKAMTDPPCKPAQRFNNNFRRTENTIECLFN